MKPMQRREEILSVLRAMQKELRVEELAEILSVSPLTIRRDLQELASEKAIIRTHGGCLAAGRVALETEYHKKVAQHFDLKQSIGKLAADHARPGDILLINDGSTTYHLATYLSSKAPLTVYTNSLAMISELGRSRDIVLYVVGGRYVPDLYSLRGSLTEQILESLSIDVTFLSTDSIDGEGRCMARSPEEASLARAMIRSGRKKILLADHTKLAAKGYVAFGALSDFDLWITTPGIDPNKLEAFGRKTEIVEAEV